MHYTIDNLTVNVASQQQLLAAVQQEKQGIINTLNLQHLVEARRSQRFHDAYRQARWITADGAPVVLIGRLLKQAVGKVTGSDLVLPLCYLAQQQGWGVYLLGTKSQVVLDKAAAAIQRQVPGCKISGSAPMLPLVGADEPIPESWQQALRDIQASQAKVVFLALGAPKQEIMAAWLIAHAPDKVYLCCGGSLDFLAGEQKRAPKWLQNMQLEFLWRLLLQPRRMAGRYAQCLVCAFRLIPKAVFAKKPII